MGRKKNTTQSQRNAGILGKIVNVLTDPRSVRKLNVLTRCEFRIPDSRSRF